MATAGEIWTGMSGQSRGDDSGAGKYLGQAPDIKNPYEDLTAQVLAQQGRDRLARQQEKQKAQQVLEKYQDGLAIKNYQDQYATKAAEKVISQSNNLGKLYSEPDGATKAFQQAKIYEAENLAESEKAKKTYDAIGKWTADGAKLVQEDTLGKYDTERYASKMDEMNKLLEAGDFNAVEKFVNDPNNTPLVAKVDPNAIIKNYIQPKRKDMRDGSQVFDEDAATRNFEIFLNNEDSPEIIDALIKTGYGKDAAEVEKNLMDQARLTPIYPAPRSNSDGDGGTKSDYEAVATYNKDFGGEAGKTNVVTINPKGQTVKSVVFFDGQNQYQTSGQFSIHPDKSGKGYVVTALVAPSKPSEPPKTASEEEKLAFYEAEAAYDSGKNINKDFWVSNNPQDAGHTNYQTISNLIGQDLQTLIGQDTGGAAPSATEAKGGAAKKTIKRSEIRAKAAAAGDYTDAEYEAILKKNGVTITED